MNKKNAMLACLQQQQILLFLLLLCVKKLQNRSMWVRPIFQQRDRLGEFRLVEEMRNDVECFQHYFRMDPATFDELLSLIEDRIEKKTTNYRVPISAKERLAITLRYLSTGDSQQTVSFSYRVGHTTVGKIVYEVCRAIWNTLMPLYLKAPSSHVEWMSIASQFKELWNFPSCIGAIDGKHVAIQAPGHSGSEFFNYKGYHSIVLLAVCDAQYRFTMIDIGDSGHQSDGGVFANSSFGKSMEANQLSIPPPSCIPGTASGVKIPYHLVGDAAFPLKTYLMRPYPGRFLPESKKIFNYRLSRARRVIENAFGILVTRWRIFKRPIIAKPENVVTIVKAACCLHNYLQTKSTPTDNWSYFSYIDREDAEGNIIPGAWRMDMSSNLLPIPQTGSNMYSRTAGQVRDMLKDYFVSASGSLPWQLAVVNRM